MEDAERKQTGGTTERILKAAAEIFASEGYDGARVDQIAERAGVNKAMLYYHIGDKAELYGEVVLDTLKRANEGISANLQAANTPEDKFRAVVLAVAQAVGQSRHLPQIMLREIASGGANLPESALRGMAGVFSTIRTVLVEGQEQGIFRDVNPLLTHFMIAGSILFLLASAPIRPRLAKIESLPEATAESPSDIGTQLADLVLNGLMCKAADGPGPVSPV
ncbi:MAG: TetR/AcrR family transcriptional regulator [Acidobacteriota bacterium]